MNPPDLLLDLNVVMDLLQGREPHAREAEALFRAAGADRVRLWISGDAPSTLFYLLERGLRQQGRPDASAQAQAALRKLCRRLSVAPVDGSVLERAFSFGMDDFEDAIQAACADAQGIRVLVTRDTAGFGDLPAGVLAVLSPSQALALAGS